MRLIDADGSYTLNASDNTDYSLCFGGGIISVIDKHGHITCEFFADDAPAVDEPVRHGHWEYVETHLLDTYYRCSECGNVTRDYIINKQTFKHDKLYYCPNCGAKMDGGSEDD